MTRAQTRELIARGAAVRILELGTELRALVRAFPQQAADADAALIASVTTKPMAPRKREQFAAQDRVPHTEAVVKGNTIAGGTVRVAGGTVRVTAPPVGTDEPKLTHWTQTAAGKRRLRANAKRMWRPGGAFAAARGIRL